MEKTTESFSLYHENLKELIFKRVEEFRKNNPFQDCIIPNTELDLIMRIMPK